jgi:hypothetical protein
MREFSMWSHLHGSIINQPAQDIPLPGTPFQWATKQRYGPLYKRRGVAPAPERRS